MKVTYFTDGIREDLVRLPKTKRTETERVENSIRKQLGTDSIVNIAALTNVLKELLSQ